jgi:putative mycofactocin binding protein MftB
VLDRRLALDPRVALRDEPFGALAYHYGTRRLVFLRHPDVVTVVRSLDGTATLAAALAAAGVAEHRGSAFERAAAELQTSGLIHDADPRPDDQNREHEPAGTAR